MADKLTSLTGFGEGDPKPDKSDALKSKVSKVTRDKTVANIKKAGSEYSAKHALYSKEGVERNRAFNAKSKAISKKSGGKVGYEAGPRKLHTPNGRKQSWYADPKNSPFN